METITINADTYTHGAFDKWPKERFYTCQWPSREMVRTPCECGFRCIVFYSDSLRLTFKNLKTIFRRYKFSILCHMRDAPSTLPWIDDKWKNELNPKKWCRIDTNRRKMHRRVHLIVIHFLSPMHPFCCLLSSWHFSSCLARNRLCKRDLQQPVAACTKTPFPTSKAHLT